MQFTNPIWLAGLSGVLIPLAIHLLSRKEGKIIRIGSIRHFEETSTRQFKSIKLNEILLLVLRTLLILFIILFLSGLTWPGSSSSEKNWLLIEQGLEHDPELKTLVDSLSEKGFEKRAFTKDFPILEESIAEGADNYWTLIESLKQQSLNEVVILSANRSNAFRGKRIELPANFAWMSKPLPAREEIINEIKINNDSTWTRRGKFSNRETEMETKINSSQKINVPSPDTLFIDIVVDKHYAYDAKLLITSLKTVDQYLPHILQISRFDPSSFQKNVKTDWTFWLSDQPFTTASLNSLRMKARPSTDILEQKTSTTWLLTQRLYPENIVKENLTSRLAQMLFPEQASWQRASALDIRMEDDELIASDHSSSEKIVTASSGKDELWITLIVLTMVAERIVSYKRTQ